jgi:hypothetical protein
MAPITHRSRLHLLAAKDAPVIVILQRKRAKLFHVVTMDTQTHQISEGSWFRGVIYGIDCDVSFDGQFMVYRARGTRLRGGTWSGVCRLPWLKTLVHVESPMTGGGFFAAPGQLATHGWDYRDVVESEEIPFKVARDDAYHLGDEQAVIYSRFARDGFTRLGDNWGTEEKVAGKRFRVACVGDDGWGLRPADGYPMLQVRYLGYNMIGSGPAFAFSLPEHPAIVEGAIWVTWDCARTLWVARPGVVAQYTLGDIRAGTPSFSLDVDRFAPAAGWLESADAQAGRARVNSP